MAGKAVGRIVKESAKSIGWRILAPPIFDRSGLGSVIGKRVAADLFFLGHVSVQTTKRYRDHASTQGSNSTRPGRSPDLCSQRTHKPNSYRTSRSCRLESQTSRQGPHHCGDLHTYAQCPLQVDQAYSSAPEGSSTAPSRALHAAASSRGIGRERRSLRGDAR